jgi:hypothetical protein
VHVVLPGVAAAALMASCGGSAPVEKRDACSVTLSGAVAGSFDCTPAFATSEAFNFPQTGAAGEPHASAFIQWPNLAPLMPVPGTYRPADANFTAIVNVMDDAGRSWSATAGSSFSPQGSYVLTITAVRPPRPGSTSFEVDGSLDATLTALTFTGSTGEITLHAQF